MTAVTPEFCSALIKQARGWQRDFRSRFGNTFVFLADEFYLRAAVPIPGRAHYGDYPQIEDGVGMVRRFVTESDRTLSRIDAIWAAASKNESGNRRESRGSLRGTIVTGELFFPILSRYVSEINNRLGTGLKVIAARNGFFGEEMTVAGLMTGRDALAARDRIEGNFLIVPEQACLKSGDIFLDDLSIKDLGRELRIPVAHGGASLGTMIETAFELEHSAGA
jgi:NifB/MoaA-like Fe-S oxidoreductase